jgi:hypothetical protein
MLKMGKLFVNNELNGKTEGLKSIEEKLAHKAADEPER